MASKEAIEFGCPIFSEAEIEQAGHHEWLAIV
jgi:hypothetical protein